MNNNKDRTFKKLRQMAEEIIQTNPPENKLQHTKDIAELIEDLHIHQVELELQNQQLQETTRQLEDLQRDYFDIYEFAPCGYITMDTEGIITRANLTTSSLLNRDRQSIIGRTFHSFLTPEFSSVYLEAMAGAASGNDQHLKLRCRISEDDTRWFRTDVRAQGDDGHAIEQYLLTLTDITDQVEMEEKLTQRTREVESLLTEKELLMRESNHRIKNDIHVIGSFLELQMISADSDQVRQGLLKAQNMVNTMSRIYESFSSKTDFTRVNAGALLQNIIGDISCLIIPDETDLDVSLDNIIVSSKASVTLGLILNEILTNAAKYAVPNSDHPAVSITLRKFQPDIAELTVADNGPGIPEEIGGMGNIGNGLGLIKALTQQLNGELYIQNRGGARITIRFPCEESAD